MNLFEKFGDKKCYLCDCDIDHMIIASHIHRVTDIKNDATQLGNTTESTEPSSEKETNTNPVQVNNQTSIIVTPFYTDTRYIPPLMQPYK